MNKKDFIRQKTIEAKREWLSANLPKEGEINSQELTNALVGANIRRLREKLGYSLEDVVQLSNGVIGSRAGLSLKELGEENITIFQLYVLSKLLKVDVQTFLLAESAIDQIIKG